MRDTVPPFKANQAFTIVMLLTISPPLRFLAHYYIWQKISRDRLPVILSLFYPLFFKNFSVCACCEFYIFFFPMTMTAFLKDFFLKSSN